jgi:catechol O-methyltransferase
VGYSCILFGDALREAGGKSYYSLERNPEFAAIAASLVDLAGLQDVVKVMVGPSDAGIKRLHSEGGLTQIDMLFLDHFKPAYLPDLKLCEQLALIKPGSLLAADNVIKPGNPPYLEHVRSTVAEKRAKMGQANGSDEIGDSIDGVAGKHGSTEEREMSGAKVEGDPNLIYESRLVEGLEPSGVPVSSSRLHLVDCCLAVLQDAVEVTRCVGRQEDGAGSNG